MGKELFFEIMETFTRENGKMTCLMVKEHLFEKMVISMWGAGRITNNMEQDHSIILRVPIFILENELMVKRKGKGCIIGVRLVIILMEIGEMTKNKEMGY